MELIKTGIKNIRKSKMRSTLTILGVTIGIITLVIISSIGEIGTEQINIKLSQMGIESVMVSISDESSKSLSEECVKTVKQIDGVKEAIPLMAQVTRMEGALGNSKTMLWGTDNQADEILTFEIIHGRLIEPSDVSYRKNICVVDEALAVNTYGRSNIIGKNVRFLVNGAYEQFEVVGVVTSGMNTLQGLISEIVPYFAYVPYTTVQALSGRTSVDEIAVKLSDYSKSEEVSKTIKETLNTKLATENAIGVNDLLKQKNQLNGILGTVSLTLSLIACISLVVSALSIMTIMLVCVSERTREIGIKKSLGATDFDIMLEIVVESVLITVIGSIIGITLGCTLIFIACKILNVEYMLNLNFIGISLAVSMIAGAVIGVYPAYKAAKLRPVEALRRE